MAVVGYARVSTLDQDLEVQLDQLKAAGCTKIFHEKVSALAVEERKELARCMNYLRDGDVLVVTRLDRLARSVHHFSGMIAELGAKGVDFRCVHQPIDTTAASGRLMMQVLAAFAEFEMSIRKERQAEGIAKAKARGVYTHKNQRRHPPQAWGGARRMLRRGCTFSETAKVTGIAESKLYERFPEYVKKKAPGSTKTPPPDVPTTPSAAEAVVENHTAETPTRKPGIFGRFLGG